MKHFIITPVRSISPEHKLVVDAYVETLKGEVHYPPRDTPQEHIIEFDICACNRAAIISADIVHIAWDGESQGCMFDLGMVFALGKKLCVIEGCFPETTPHKSFQNLVREYILSSIY